MEVKVYWDNGDIETWKPTFMSYSDGVLLENDRLVVESVQDDEMRYVKSISYLRRCFTSNLEQLNQEVLLPIIAAESVENILAVEVDGVTRFEHNGFGCLVDLACLEETAGGIFMLGDEDGLREEENPNQKSSAILSELDSIIERQSNPLVVR